jgi:hypothetical protein
MTGYGDKKIKCVDNQPIWTERNPSTKTNKDDKEPSWLLALRKINETMTSTIIVMKTTQQPFQRKP